MLTTYITPPDGPETAPPLLIAHGLFGSARNWGAMAKRLATGRRVVTVDMRNHGASPWHPTHRYEDLAADLAEVIAAQGTPMDVLGHSMGGKAAMVLALTCPDHVRRLVVGDIAPVAYGHSQRHLIDAMRGLDLSAVTRRSDADAALQGEISDPGVRAFLLQSLDVAGRRWLLNLDVLAAEMPRITGWPDLPGAFRGPVLVLVGEQSGYVRPEHHASIAALFPASRLVTVAGAGHWLHADRPAEVAVLVHDFLDG
ncbi:MAG: alpha/beta fold hydrolase [Rhodobacteraceae bacterium]|jgi:pimeloyl-ACP methyl ester carboxylesterase|nr:alpha/beta fold hydrolase [Paracoccaceae bacterium]